MLSKEDNQTFSVEHINDLDSWFRGEPVQVDQFSSNEIDESPWEFVSEEIRNFFERLRRENETVLDDITNIFVGLQTSADSIYILEPSS